MATPNVSFQVQNEAGVVFTINVPYGVAHGTGNPHNPMRYPEQVLRDLIANGYLPVKAKQVNETVQANLNGGHKSPAGPPPPPRPAPEDAFSEPPIGSGKPRAGAKSNGDKLDKENASPASNGTGKFCPLHSTKMRRREGDNGDVWYSHKHDGEWCKGAGTNSEIAAKKVRVSG